MSKQPNDQEGVQKSSADAPQTSSKPNDAAAPASSTPPASTADGRQTQSSTSGGADTQPAGGTPRNGRSRRRGKGGGPQQNQAASGASSTASSPAAPAQGSATAATPGTDKPSAASTASSTTARPEATPSGSGTPPPPPSRHQGKNGGGKGGLLALVLVVLLAVALVIVAWQGWQRLDSQQQRINELSQQAENSVTQQTVSDLESRIESSESERDQTLESTLDELRGELDSYRSDIDSTLDDVLAQLSQAQDTDDRDWLHAEAAYLLRLANQRLQLEGDVEGAAALLRTADARLADADNPALTPVRREIANELAALDDVPRVDRTGLYLALNAQQERVAGLRLSQEIEERAVTSGIEQPPTGTFQRQLARFGEELKDLVVIRHHDEAMETLVTPEQESYLRQSLRLILEQAQLALLKEEQPLYEASIDKALELLNGYYDVERDATQSVIERLQELKQAEIEPELPDISASQQAMTRFIENRFRSRQQDGEEGGDA
ncbi:uroporphyrinogen-III C-methyltransferase [Halomonas aquamarina]|uniref:Uroporphyrinogen-III C-methyltransferase n=1 Tax=Vreelandella aquamarina TaxID=77097 RepID=A0ACC5VUD0_9GAMM|nr:uroporphyrinogen-III C-methyltransferase [Halomonas aquamarina]MBZ5487570.1 uroporphyrinogen-III C-methyltransferase [Halomonas aquamarina]